MAREDNRRDRRDRDETPEFADRLVAINRVSKTVKGGKRFGFAALVVVGDQRAASASARARPRKCPRRSARRPSRPSADDPRAAARRPHAAPRHRGAPRRRPRRDARRGSGTGIIAGGPMRAVFEMLGLQDVVAKSLGSQNPYNMIRATMDGLKLESSPRMVAQRRGKKVADILRKDETVAETAEA
jgi:small subunit ribosomal protein S5